MIVKQDIEKIDEKQVCRETQIGFNAPPKSPKAEEGFHWQAKYFVFLPLCRKQVAVTSGCLRAERLKGENMLQLQQNV